MRRLEKFAPVILAFFAVAGIVIAVNAGSLGPPVYPSGGSSGANPSQSIDGSVHNGSATTFMRSDAAPAIASGCAITNAVLTTPNLGVPSAGTLDACTYHLTINTQANDYTAVLSDDGKEIQMTKGSATTLSIDTDANQAFPVGTQLNIVQYGAGALTIQASNSGTTTIHSTGGTPAAPIINAQYGMAVAIKQAANVWLVSGNIK